MVPRARRQGTGWATDAFGDTRAKLLRLFVRPADLRRTPTRSARLEREPLVLTQSEFVVRPLDCSMSPQSGRHISSPGVSPGFARCPPTKPAKRATEVGFATQCD